MKQDIKDTLLSLAAKLVLTALLLAALLGVLYGIVRCPDNTMSPACGYGDLILFDRTQKSYQTGQVVVLTVDGKPQIRRIAAVPGDVVEITEDGLKLNGYFQQESGIYTQTLPFAGDVTYPPTVPAGEYFVLADDRTNAQDSRGYGTVSQDEIRGCAIALLRHRDI